MSAITLTDLNNILEKIIRPAVEDQLYAETILWNMFGGYQPNVDSKKDAMPRLNMQVLNTSMNNQNFYIPIVTAHSSGAVATSGAAGSLVAGKPTTGQAEITAVYETGTFQIDKPTLSIKDAGVAVRQLDFFMKQNSLGMIIDLNRQCYGDGTGTIGTANAGTTSTTFVFKASPNGDIDYTRYTPPGTNLIIGSNSSVSVLAVTGVNTVTLSSSLTWNTGDAVKKADGNGVAAVEMTGLALSNSTSTYQTIAYNSASWAPGYLDSTSTTLKLGDMNKAFTAINKVGNVKYIIMNQTEFNSYANQLQTQIRFQYDKVLGGGWTGIDFMGGRAKVVLDYDNPDDHIQFISPDYWGLGELSPYQYEKGTDGYLTRLTGSLVYEGVGTWFGNLYNVARSATGALYNRVG